MDVIAIATYLFYSLGNGRILFIPISFIHFLFKDIGVEGGFAYAVATVTLQIVLLSLYSFLRNVF